MQLFRQFTLCTCTLVLVPLTFAGCDRDADPSGGLEPTPVASSPADTEATPTDSGATAIDDAAYADFAGVRAPMPDSWVQETPDGSMRSAQFNVPGVGDAGDAEFVVFGGIGGSNDANIARWVGQFSSPDGTGVEPELGSLEVSGMPITTVYLTGIYSGMLPSGAPTEAQNDAAFLAAIVEAPGTILHLRLVGPRETVDANREAFMAMINGLNLPGS